MNIEPNSLAASIIERFEQSVPEGEIRTSVTEGDVNSIYVFEKDNYISYYSLEVSLMNVLLDMWRAKYTVNPLSVLIQKLETVHKDQPDIMWMSAPYNENYDSRRYVVAACNTLPEVNGTSMVNVHKICALLSAISGVPLDIGRHQDGIKVEAGKLAGIIDVALNKARDSIMEKYHG